MRGPSRHKPPQLLDEPARLAALRRYRILDTPHEQAFERITTLAARLFEVPVSQISFVDQDREWLKSCYDSQAKSQFSELPRELSFCSHTILENTLTVAADMRLDARFADSPFVTAEPHVRFYAGAPLTTPDGYNLGALCLIDFAPRELSPAQQATLGDLAALVMDELELRLALEREAALHQQANSLNDTLEARVSERTAALEHANQELEAFSYSVAHHLRSPLTGIDGFSQLVLEHAAERLDDTVQGYLLRIRESATRMGRAIDGLLELTRLSRRELACSVVNLSHLATAITTTLHKQQPERRATFDVAEALMGYGDIRLLYIALNALLTNAWAFTAEQTVARIEFGVTRCAEEDTHENTYEDIYFVRDNGVGFDMRYADKLFEPFQHLHTPAEHDGAGVGLAMTARIVRRHGGRIWAEAEVGKGATFYFTLPPAEDAAPLKEAPLKEAPLKATPLKEAP